MNYMNYGKSRDLSVIWEFRKNSHPTGLCMKMQTCTENGYSGEHYHFSSPSLYHCFEGVLKVIQLELMGKHWSRVKRAS
jgi:hypothetical protein